MPDRTNDLARHTEPGNPELPGWLALVVLTIGGTRCSSLVSDFVLFAIHSGHIEIAVLISARLVLRGELQL